MGTSKTAVSNLPIQLTTFIGREVECASVAALLTANRLVTLVGAGGCGKTRLAHEVAARSVEGFEDGVSWVDLAPLSDDTFVGNEVAAAMAVKEVSGQSIIDTLKDHVRDRAVLLTLDNCEHVVDACASLVDELLRTCPSLSVLATSREPLGVEGEVPWRVPSLSLPEVDGDSAPGSVARAEAVHLFVDRATRVNSTFRLTDDNAAAVVEICRRLDGIPLAIELAAARVRMMRPEEIVAGLEDRFRLLTGSTRTAVPRHQTLRASADWSYALLTEEERVVLRRLAVFAGGATLEAADDVCSGAGIARESVLGALSRLIDRSLVHVGEEAGATRFRLLETIRQYATERLAESGEDAAVRTRHAGFFVALAERARPEMEGAGLVEWLNVFDGELDNIRAAFDWGVESGKATQCLRLMSALFHFWLVRGHLTEGRQRFEAALAAGGSEPLVRAMALIDAGQLMISHGDLVATRAFATEALRIARGEGDRRLEGRALDTLGFSTAFLDPAAAPEVFQAAASILRDAGDAMYLADALNGLGLARLFEGDYIGARQALEEGVARSRKIGNMSLLTIGLGLLGYVLELQGYLARARTHLEESLSLARRIHDRVSEAQALYCLGFIEAHRGEPLKADAYIDESVGIAREASPLILAFALLTQGITRYMRADLEGSAAALEESLHLSHESPASWPWVWGMAMLADVARMKGEIEVARERVAEALAAAKRSGIRVDVLIDADARLSRSLGDFERAESLHHEALAAARAGGSVLLVPTQLEALAGLAGVAESHAEAARLFGAAEAARDSYGLIRHGVDQSEYDVDVARVRAAMRADQFRAAWEQGRAMSLEDAVAYTSRGRGERKRPASGWASLTPTEIEVVRRAAEGLTNQQIAERLFVSRSTVKAHLVHIFAKLGISTRAELASEAVKRGL